MFPLFANKDCVTIYKGLKYADLMIQTNIKLFQFFSSMFGILFGLLITLVTVNKTEIDNKKKKKKAIILTLISLAILMAYHVFIQTCSSKVECNNIFPFISVFPVSLLIKNQMTLFVTKLKML